MWSFTFTPEELHSFITESSEHCYLGEFKKATIIERPGFFEMDYEKGDFTYRDSFVGYYRSAGQELVRHKLIPVWATQYSGGVIDKFIGNNDFFTQVELFLRTALSKSDDKNVFSPRGPVFYTNEEWEYECSWDGDITAFNGVEHIHFKGEQVFYHNFFGGVIIGK